MNDCLKKPELMSPAGYWPQLRTAIEAGADAVYFGLNHFSARAKVGFTIAELPDVMNTLHERAVKGFVTFNTLVFDHELELAEQAIIDIANANVDAIIVQDIGIARLAKQIAPELEIHGSTQMSITSAEGAELARSLGCSRVVLGRELSLADIRSIATQTDVELEVFVHGALCVSYSGQCFSSEAWGGRSANRGKCAQACRLSYDLIVDGQRRELGPYRYLLSPGDLYALEQIPELVEIGVACLKIEGRYKDADYVALTTRAYREAIDLAVARLPVEPDEDERLDLEQIYSRGLGPHFISGVNHQTVVQERAPRHRGLLMGKVVDVLAQSVIVELEHTLFPGDGIVFDAADWRSPDLPEEGGNIYEVKDRHPQQFELKFGHGEIEFARIREGDLVWRTSDPQLKKKLKPLTANQKPVFTHGLHFEVITAVGQPLKIIATTDIGESVTVIGDSPLESAHNRSLDMPTLHDKLGRLGGTPFHITDVDWSSDEPVFVPTSQLNQARRDLVEKLLAQRTKPDAKIVNVPDARIASANSVGVSVPDAHDASANSVGVSVPDAHDGASLGQADLRPMLHLLVRTAEQLTAAIECRPESITLDYLELYGLRPSIEQIQAAGITARVASPRILKPSEQKIVRFLLSLDCEILVRSGGLLKGLVDSCLDLPALCGDFSLNAANALSVESYLQMGLNRITPTYDLNSKQIEGLTERIPCSALEVIVYSHLPVFHTEHCVFCRFLSDGTDSTNCGHPCEKYRVAVRDSSGREHPVMADVGCRNTVFGAEAQTDPNSLARWESAGIKHYRIEFVHQSPPQVAGITGAFRDHIDKKINASQLGNRTQPTFAANNDSRKFVRSRRILKSWFN